jgi:hypothetical protein
MKSEVGTDVMFVESLSHGSYCDSEETVESSKSQSKGHHPVQYHGSSDTTTAKESTQPEARQSSSTTSATKYIPHFSNPTFTGSREEQEMFVEPLSTGSTSPDSPGARAHSHASAQP